LFLGGLCLLITSAGVLSFDRWLSGKCPPSTPECTQ
jgi:hypothetical protein